MKANIIRESCRNELNIMTAKGVESVSMKPKAEENSEFREITALITLSNVI